MSDVRIERDGGVTAITLARPERRNAITVARRQAKRVPHYMEVRYEDLIADTEAALRRICEFAELEFDPAMLTLATMGAILAPLILPRIAQRMGIDTSAPDFETRYADQLKRMIRHPPS